MKEIINISGRNCFKCCICIGGDVNPVGTLETWSVKGKLLRIFLSTFSKQIRIAKQPESEVPKSTAFDLDPVKPTGISKSTALGIISANSRRLVFHGIGVHSLADSLNKQISVEECIYKTPLVSNIQA